MLKGLVWITFQEKIGRYDRLNRTKLLVTKKLNQIKFI